MKKILVGTTVAAAILGAAACTYSGDEQTSDPFPEEAPADSEAPAPSAEEGAPPEAPGPVTLEEGGSHEYVDEVMGESFTLRVEDVRYMSEITSTDPYMEGSADVATSFDGTGYFAVVDLEYTNSGSTQVPYPTVFDSYTDLEGTVTPIDNAISTTYSDGTVDEYWVFSAEDVGATALLTDVEIPAGATVQASEVVPVPEKSGYLYSLYGDFRLKLPKE